MIRNWMGGWLVVFVAGAVSTGCGGNASSGDGAAGAAGASGAGNAGESDEGAPVARVEFELTLSVAVCAAADACCTDAGQAATKTCTETLTDYAKHLAADTSRYDPAAARRCIDAYAAASSTCAARILTPEVEAACAPLHELTLLETVIGATRAGLGEPCNATCASESCSAPGQSGPYSVCSTRQDGLWCGPDKTCQPVARVGEACTDLASCEDGATCGPTGTCTRLAATLGPCEGSWDCWPRDECTAGTCQPRTVVGDGACGN